VDLEINNNPFIRGYNILEHVIRTQVDDINPVRKELPTSKERQWIFPYTPEDLTLHYPRIAIVLDSVTYSEFGSGQHAGYQTEPTTGEVSDVLMNYITLHLTIGVFTKKKQKFEVILPGKTDKQLASGTLLNFYLFGEVQKAILKNRDYFYQNDVDDFNITGVSPAYNDTEVLIASDLTMNLMLPNVWDKTYTTGELIAEINKTYNVELT